MEFLGQHSARKTALLAATALALSAAHFTSALAKDSQAFVDSATTYTAKGNFKAAEIELRNAEREAPEDAHVRALLAETYLRLGEFGAAETEARAARRLHGAEADYLLPLAEAMLRQGKAADIAAEIKPGDRTPELESKIRAILSVAALNLHDRPKAEGLLLQAIELDPKAVGPKLALAKLLLESNTGEAAKLVDKVLAADPKSAEAIAVRGEIAAKKGDTDRAMQQFADALAIDKANITAHLSRANINLSRGDYAAVDQDLDPVLKAAPKNFGGNYLRALELFKKRDFAGADRLLTEMDPSFAFVPEGYYVEAATKYSLNQYGQAADAIAKYIARVPQNPLGARLAAMIALRRGAPDSAVDYLNDYLAKGTPDQPTLTLLGNAYAAMNKPALALEQYQKAASLAPDSPVLKTLVAASEIDVGAGGKGLDELEKVFDTDAGMTIAGPTLVLTELKSGHYDKAAQAASKLVEHDGKNVLYQNLLAMARISQKDYPAAETILKDLVEKNPDFAPARVNLAHLYAMEGKVDEAKKVYLDFLARKPDDPASLLGLEQLAANEKKWDEAIGYATKAHSVAPSDPAPGLELLKLYAQRQEWDRAKALASEMTVQFPQNAQVFAAQGAILAASGDQADAIESYRHAYETDTNSGPIIARYLDLLTAAKRFPEERTVLQARLDKDPSNRALRGQLIRVETEIGGLEAGLAKAQSFAKDDPDNAFYDLISADLYERAGKRQQAIALLERAAAGRTGDASVIVALSGLYDRAGDLPKAEAILVNHLKQQPDNATARAALADFYIKHAKFTAAIAQETQVLSEHPNDLAALNNLAWLYQQTGELPKAREYAEKAAAAAPASGAVEDTLGWIMLAQGDTQKALSHLQVAINATPRDPEIGYHVAVALQRAGRPVEARAVLEKLLSSGVSFASKPEAEKLLDELKRS